ncbi:MAG: hypothetical protein ACREDV_02355, partial [Methylocella sp.]
PCTGGFPDATFEINRRYCFHNSPLTNADASRNQNRSPSDSVDKSRALAGEPCDDVCLITQRSNIKEA